MLKFFCSALDPKAKDIQFIIKIKKNHERLENLRNTECALKNEQLMNQNELIRLCCFISRLSELLCL